MLSTSVSVVAGVRASAEKADSARTKNKVGETLRGYAKEIQASRSKQVWMTMIGLGSNNS